MTLCNICIWFHLMKLFFSLDYIDAVFGVMLYQLRKTCPPYKKIWNNNSNLLGSICKCSLFIVKLQKRKENKKVSYCHWQTSDIYTRHRAAPTARIDSQLAKSSSPPFIEVCCMKLASFILLTGDCRYVSRDQRALSFFLPSLSNICDTHVAPCILYREALLFSASVFSRCSPSASSFHLPFRLFTPNLVCLSPSVCVCGLWYRFTFPGIQLLPAIMFHRKQTMCGNLLQCSIQMLTAALFAVSSQLSVGLFFALK